MQEVLVGVEGRCAGVDVQQLLDVAVQVLNFTQVDLVFLQVAGKHLIQGDQVFQMHSQDGHPEAPALSEHPSIAAVVAAGGQQVHHLVQDL